MSKKSTTKKKPAKGTTANANKKKSKKKKTPPSKNQTGKKPHAKTAAAAVTTPQFLIQHGEKLSLHATLSDAPASLVSEAITGKASVYQVTKFTLDIGALVALSQPKVRNADRECLVDGCTSGSRARGLCDRHYQAQRRVQK